MPKDTVVPPPVINYELQKHRVLLVDKTFKPLPNPFLGIVGGSTALSLLESKRIAPVVASQVYHVGPLQTRRLPSVAMLKRAYWQPQLNGLSNELRHLVRLRDRGLDLYETEPMLIPSRCYSVDHIRPRSQFPALAEDMCNLLLTHRDRNHKKSNRSLAKMGWTILSQPFAPTPDEHWWTYLRTHSLDTMPPEWAEILARFDSASVRDECWERDELYQRARATTTVVDDSRESEMAA